MTNLLTENIFYVGVNDRTKHLFESLWPIPYGVSYNSYLLIDEKVALIDTVDVCYSEVFFKKIDSVLKGRAIDYLVVNHMEPDHSGSIRLLKQLYPALQLIGNKKTGEMLSGYYGVEKDFIEVKDNEEINLGTRSLRFYMTPMVHWPETMMTYDIQSETLFPGDAFGTYGALNGGVIDERINVDIYQEEMIRYYANIVGKYGSPVQKAMEKLRNVPIQMICSTHGPVWKKDIPSVLSIYDKLSRYEGEPGVVVAYGSMYGNTEQTAEFIAGELSAAGVKNIVMHNVSKTHGSYILKDIFKYNGLIIGSPTYSNELFPLVQSLLDEIETRTIKNRFFGYFGSFTWADASVKRFVAFAEQMGWDVVSEPICQKYTFGEEQVAGCMTLAKNMAAKVAKKG